MRLRSTLVAIGLMVALGASVFFLVQRQLSSSSFVFGAHPEVLEQLETALSTTRELANRDPENQAIYRARFDALDRTLGRLKVLERSREELRRRYQLLLLLIFAGSVVVATSLYAYRQSRHGPRLEKLREALEELAVGRGELVVGVRGRDSIGRIASMIEETSRVMARNRRRLAALRNLSAWQEAARRHAHEMRTPLTGARLGLGRILDLAQTHPEPDDEIQRAASGALEELERLGVFTRQFTSFARLPQPRLRPVNPRDLLRDFATTYAGAWENLQLVVDPEESGDEETGGSTPGRQAPSALVDRDMLRQVLVNLCENSAQAVGDEGGTVRLSARACQGPLLGEGRLESILLEVADDGPGIAEEVRGRLFEPYTTTRTVGEGMGLGLAISKKILLDHGGDLELSSSSASGTVFHLILPGGIPPEPGGDPEKEAP